MSDNGSAPNPAGLEVRGLQVRYRGGLALHSVDFALAPGGRMAVVGRNGAGKSSLVRAIAGLVPAYAGKVQEEGEDVEADEDTAEAELTIAAA